MIMMHPRQRRGWLAGLVLALVTIVVLGCVNMRFPGSGSGSVKDIQDNLIQTGQSLTSVKRNCREVRRIVNSLQAGIDGGVDASPGAPAAADALENIYDLQLENERLSEVASNHLLAILDNLPEVEERRGVYEKLSAHVIEVTIVLVASLTILALAATWLVKSLKK